MLTIKVIHSSRIEANITVDGYICYIAVSASVMSCKLWGMTCTRSLCQIGLHNYEKLRQLGGYYFGKSPLVTKQDLFLKWLWELWVVLKITQNSNSHQTNWQYLPTKSRHSKSAPNAVPQSMPSPLLMNHWSPSFPLLRELRGAYLLSSGKMRPPKSSPCWIDGSMDTFCCFFTFTREPLGLDPLSVFILVLKRSKKSSNQGTCKGSCWIRHFYQ